jgi:hypothetical protein
VIVGEKMSNSVINPNLILNPNLFFSEKSKNDVKLIYPALVIFVNAIFAVITGFLLINKIKEALPSEASSFILIGAAIGAFGGLIGAFANWIILTGIFYLISSLFNSEGSFKRTLEFVGYGFVPLIFASFINIFVFYSSISSINLSQDPQLIATQMSNLMSSNPLYRISQIVGILCTLLCANIWIFALLHARNMSFKNAALTVCIPVGLSLIYSIYTLVGGLI